MTDPSRRKLIARHDFLRAARSRLSLASVVLVVLLVLPSYWSAGVESRLVEGAPPPAIRAVQAVPAYLTTYVFVLVLAVAYGAVATERESGTVRLLLGLAGTRTDVLVGKLLGRVGVVLVVTGGIVSVMGVAIAVKLGRLPILAFCLVGGWTLAYAVSWTVFTVGLSAAFGTRYRALGAAGGVYVVLSGNAPIWRAVLRPTLRLAVPESMNPFIAAVNPTQSLFVVTGWLVGVTTRASASFGAGQAVTSVLSVVSMAVFGVWIGSKRFTDADLR